MNNPHAFVRMKFRVFSIEHTRRAGDTDESRNIAVCLNPISEYNDIVMSPIYLDGLTKRNAQYFKLGKEYYVDFIEKVDT